MGMDADKSGSISFDEFKNALERCMIAGEEDQEEEEAQP